LPDSLPYDEKELLLKIAEGDEKAFRILFDRYRDDVYKKAFFFLKSTELAEDILQEVFLAIWKNRSNIFEIQNFKAFLNVVARNTIFSQLRKSSVQSLLAYKLTSETDIGTPPAIITELDGKELRYALEKAMTLLTSKQKKVFELSRLQGLSHAEIASHLKMNKETVKKHITDALRTIRVSLKALPAVQLAFWFLFNNK
jgi:RNA polymerase sigma-70 factor (family 1)